MRNPKKRKSGKLLSLSTTIRPTVTPRFAKVSGEKDSFKASFKLDSRSNTMVLKKNKSYVQLKA